MSLPWGRYIRNVCFAPAGGIAAYHAFDDGNAHYFFMTSALLIFCFIVFDSIQATIQSR